jgi:outer membrane protein assembly factor BamE (lipoprotein component of BamABCDE complex)
MPRSLAILAVFLLLQACAGASPTPQYRSDELFGRVQPGMTQREVREILGAPANTMPFSLSRTDSWGYFGFDTWGYYTEYSVTFDADGRVVSKLARRLGDGRSRD